MPRALAYLLIWSQEHAHYELHIHGHIESIFQRDDASAFSRFLEDHTAFAFQGQAGSLSVRKEARAGKGGYWYAYRTHRRQTGKRYLGPANAASLVRLETAAQSLSQELEGQNHRSNHSCVCFV